MINTLKFELPLSKTDFHGSRVFEPLKFYCILKNARSIPIENVGKIKNNKVASPESTNSP